MAGSKAKRPCMPMHRQARVTRGQAQPEGCALLSLALEIRKRAGSVLFTLESACPDFWQIFGKRLFRRKYCKREN
jgi:hypothetical protein